MSNLHKFMESVVGGFGQSPYYEELSKIEEMMDEKLDAKVREVASELSGVFIDKLADVLESRGLALDGHKIVKGFSV